MRARVFWIAGIVVAVLVTAGIVALRGTDGSTLTPSGSLDDAATAAVKVDPRGGVVQAPDVVDSVKLATSIATKAAAEGPEGLTPEERTEYDRYLAETAAIVRDNAAGLENMVSATVAALVDDDVAGLSALWAPDEKVDAGYLESFAAAYPEMVRGEPQKTVKVVAVDKTTVYFAYAVVAWTDAGLTSTHTIEVPLRFVNGQWLLTSIGRNTSGLTNVQTVRLP